MRVAYDEGVELNELVFRLFFAVVESGTSKTAAETSYSTPGTEAAMPAGGARV